MWNKVIADNQLFLYFKGQLIYKRWLLRDKGRIFDQIGGY